MLDNTLIEQLSRFSTPTIFNGLKYLGVSVDELESVARTAVRCMAPSLGPRIGYAVTRRVATRSRGPAADPANTRRLGELLDRHIMDTPGPRFLAVENIGDPQGRMCIWGEVAATINLAMGCVAGVTNGPVRDLAEMEAAGFQAFADGAATGGGHVDSIDVGTPIEIGAMRIMPGDLLMGDLHGVIKIPSTLAPQLPEAIAAVEAREARILAFCRSKDFSAAEVARLVAG